MHEAAIAQSLIEELGRLRDEGVFEGRLQSVRLRVGRLTAVVPDYLEFMFQVLCEGTDLEDVRLAMTEVEPRGRCLTCGVESRFDELGFLCTACGSADIELIAGRELLIESLEVE